MNGLLSKSRLLVGVLFLLGAFSLSACDSNDDSGLTVDDIIGTYTFTQLSFNPTAAAIPDANVLDTLVTAQTSLLLNANGQFLLNYQFVNGAAGNFLAGTYSLNGDDVQLNINDNNEQARRTLLLPDSFTLRVLNQGAQLQADIDRSGINLADFSDRYTGVTTNGTLIIRARR
jgi:hypothetical protein